jgi:hypothetical protein
VYDSIEVPDGIEPLVGYRGWSVDNDNLYSCYRSVKWPIDGPLVAECLSPTNRELSRPNEAPKHWVFPEKLCTCGVYALHTYPKLWEVRGDGTRAATFKPWPPVSSITGVVRGWGKIILGESGFRAQYMRPIALIRRDSKYWTPIVEAVAYRYGLEIVEASDVRRERNENRIYLT